MKKRKGVLTVEAAIILPLFVMVMFFILSMLNLFYYHLVMQQALTNVGRTLSECGYVLDEIGLLDKATLKTDTKNKESELAGRVTEVVDSASRVIDGISNISLDTMPEIIENAELFSNATKNLITSLETVEEEELVNYLLISALNTGGGSLIELLIGDYLEEMKVNSNQISELRYDLYVEAGTKEILVVAEYTYKLPFEFVKPLRMQQMIRIHPWIGGKTKGAEWK